MEETGQSAIDDLIADVVYHCWTHQVTLKSDYARFNAPLIFAAMSEGFITTKLFDGCYSQHLLPTPVGLEYMQDIRKEMIF